MTSLRSSAASTNFHRLQSHLHHYLPHSKTVPSLLHLADSPFCTDHDCCCCRFVSIPIITALQTYLMNNAGFLGRLTGLHCPTIEGRFLVCFALKVVLLVLEHH